MSEFFSMGGYGLYVWGSYGVTLGVIAAEVLLLVLRKRNIVRQLGAFARSERGSA
jgi:heme exporter protein D